jgi:aryl-alcohol dehydrogenase-like predicted oxidoreductase
MTDWLYRTPTALHGKRVHRLGLAANYGIDEDGVRAAMDRGLNLFLWTRRNPGMRAPVLRALGQRREEVVVIGYVTVGWFGWGVRRDADALLRELGTDYVDVLLLGWLGMGSALTAGTKRAFETLRASGKVRAFGASIHNRPRAGRLGAERALDLLMIRYNAAHPGAEQDIFPAVQEANPSILAYTATSWRKLLKRPKGWTGQVMTAGDCYRFQLSSPHVDMALCGPASRAELEENLAALDKGPLAEDEQQWMRAFGKAVHG